MTSAHDHNQQDDGNVYGDDDDEHDDRDVDDKDNNWDIDDKDDKYHEKTDTCVLILELVLCRLGGAYNSNYKPEWWW